ncbi:uncharacterized protein [Primulina huaijiensis]|uniref:uncharacterized protein n=1 Tax=Primulina huaijiensis TaxID=1492673 RepID=UPI003CC6F918
MGGSKAFQFLNLFPIATSRNYLQEISVKNLIIWRCFSGGRSGGSRWNLDANVNLNQRSRLSDAYLTEDYDDGGEFGFKNAAKKRVWWSDDFNGKNDDDEVEEGDVGFGVQEASIGFKWISKVLRSVGWMIPAVITSLVLGTGTGTDSIFMALALPIAQSVFSFITETLWKRSSRASRTKSKSKKKTPARATSNSGPRKTKGTTTRTRPQKRSGDYTSWVASSNVSAERDFGGWDELDNQAKGR